MTVARLAVFAEKGLSATLWGFSEMGEARWRVQCMRELYDII